jgi:hypothetical protein
VKIILISFIDGARRGRANLHFTLPAAVSRLLQEVPMGQIKATKGETNEAERISSLDRLGTGGERRQILVTSMPLA